MSRRGVRVTRRGGIGEKKWDRGGQVAAGDGAINSSVEAFQFGEIGIA